MMTLSSDRRPKYIWFLALTFGIYTSARKTQFEELKVMCTNTDWSLGHGESTQSLSVSKNELDSLCQISISFLIIMNPHKT